VSEPSISLSRRDALSGGAAFSILMTVPSILHAQSAPIICPIVTARGRLWIGVEIDGQGPFPFIIDTGAHLSLIEEATAKRLRLPTAGYTRVNGVGGQETLRLYATHDVVIGGSIRDKDTVFAAMQRRVSPDAIGTLSAGIMTQLDSDMDFAAGEWRLYPDGRPGREGFTRVDSDITHVGSPEGSAYIFAHAAVNGQMVDFLLDTGAPQAIYLGPGATQRSGLWDDARPYVPMRRNGIGGAAERLSRLVRAESFQIGDVRFDRPLILLADPGQGDAKRLREGVIGLPVLEQLVLSTDVRARKLWVKGTGGTPPPERYGLSGLWLDTVRGKTIVSAVGTGSPARAAGVSVGDEIVGLPLAQAIRTLAQAPGTDISFTLRHADGRTETVGFRLAAYL